jgi:hypothetical protein
MCTLNPTSHVSFIYILITYHIRTDNDTHREGQPFIDKKEWTHTHTLSLIVRDSLLLTKRNGHTHTHTVLVSLF